MKLMKITFFLAGLLFISTAVFAQQNYKVEKDKAGNKMLVGQLNMQQLVNDSAFRWFYSGINKYQPTKEWVNYIRYYKDSFSVVVFAGTWDVNTKQLLPAFYRTMMAVGYPLNKIKLYGVDNELHALHGEAEKYNVKKLPSIILLQNGEEFGRIEAVPVQSVEANIVAILQTRFVPETAPSQAANP